ncbi:SCP2 domain-containing protein [Thalassolituus sp.]|jgi:ubiquinone biosynthesis protein UbiJ|uniref:ubiquinone biosynthesis accessory factor UbiJ n=1 Tax=Thalassolituus sp. TaxID=2030822 RepID=UPI003510E579
MISAVLTQALCLPVETLINRALREDPATLTRLAKQEGRLLAVEVSNLGRVNVRLLRDGIALSMTQDSDAEVVLSGTASDFLGLARADDKAHELINSQIDMQGDTELALFLTRTLDKLDIDWEAAIQPLTGSLLAHQVGKGIRGLLKWRTSTGNTYRTAAKEYLEDELNLVTPQPLLDRFAEETDQLRLRADRLSARIAQLENQTSTPEE